MRGPERRFSRLLTAAALCACLGPAVALAADRSSSYLAALESITTDELQGHVDYLADDALEGRLAGSRGGRQAGDYLAQQLASLGLRGAGLDGGFFQPLEPDYRNVLARLEGSDPELKQQYVIVGAHYDHLGYGDKKSSRGPVGQIHNGADDNASGTSGLLELAEAFTTLPQAPRRSILFAFWDAEEKGMLGSKHWIAHPTLPIEHVVATLDADMIGRLREDRLVVVGTRTGYGWRRLVTHSNQDVGLKLEFPWTASSNSDYWPFLGHGIPALMLHTDVHDDYHRPSDDAHLINADGLCRVGRLLFAITYDLADRDAVPAFREDGRQEKDSNRQALLAQRPQRRERLGVAWGSDGPPGRGVHLSTVTAGSPADRAGLEPGDRIVALAGRPIHTGQQLTWAVSSAENPVSIEVERPGHDGPVARTVQLDGRPMRLGLAWQVDDAEPGTVVLTDVTPGSPAAAAGLEPGDRVYQIGGRDFPDETQFAELAKTLPAPLKLLVERNGRLLTVELHLGTQPLERAA